MKLINLFRDAPIGRKLMLIGLLTTALALFSVSLILVARGWVDWRDKTVAEMENYAALIGANAAPSMIFADYEAANEVLRTVGGNSDIVDVVLYDRDGKVFARYRAPEHPDAAFPFVKPDSYLFSFDQLVVSKPVMLKGETWGTVYLESDLRGLYAAIGRQAQLTFIAAAGVFMVAVFLFSRLQRAIVDPVTNLSGVMRRVSAQQDYAVRVPVLGKDEVGVLAGTFNDMLAQIQVRDEALERHRAHLEEEVAQRTAELRENNRLLEHELVERKRAEESMERLRRELAMILESAGEGICTMDTDGNHVMVNPSAARMFGYEVEEMIGRHSHSLWHYAKADGSPYPGEECPIYATMQDGVVRRSDSEVFWRKGGISFPVEYVSTPIRSNGAITGTVVVFRDITEHKQAEEALRKANVELGLFRTLIDNSSDGIYVIEPATMRLLDVNEQVCRDLGYSRDELLAMSVFDIDPLFTEEARKQAVAQLQESGANRFESLHRRKDGATHPVEISSGYVELDKPYILSTVRDITERRRAEAERRRLSEAVEQSMEAIVLTDMGRSIIYVNPSFTRLFGYSAQEVVGQSIDLLMVEDSTYPAPHQTSEIALAQGAYSGETMRRGKDGRAILVLLNVATVRDEQNRISGYVGTMTDLTELKHAETEAQQRMVELTHANVELRELNARLAQAQTQLMQSEKMASIGMLAAGVAHEINNPIGYIRSNLGALDNYIGSFLDLLDAYEEVERSMPDRSELFAGTKALKGRLDIAYIRGDVVALLHESHEGVDRVTKIVQDLKDFSRVETEEQWTSENIHHGIDSTLNVIWNELKYKCEVVKEYGELPNIDCLPSQLNQVFMNLLVNAAQAIETRGRITIRTGQEGERVWVEVGDTGQGIPPENIPHLFDPFFTTKPVGKGTGLGLSVSYNIIGKHHGKIEVQSEVGKGTTFRVWLPIRQIKESA